jgi:hypothetical protein
MGIVMPVLPKVRIGYTFALLSLGLILKVEAVTSGRNKAPAPAVAVKRKKSRLFKFFAFIVKTNLITLLLKPYIKYFTKLFLSAGKNK